MGKLDGKVCVITGASRGIGAGIAQLFAEEGGKVVAAARTLREGDHPLEGSLEKTVADIRESGGEATASAVNISLPEDCERLFQEAHDAYGSVDVLVNNAALTYFIPVKDYPLQPTGASRHDREEERQHRKHFFRGGHRAGSRTLSRRPAEFRGHVLWRRESCLGALFPGTGAGSLPAWNFSHMRVTLPGGPNPRDCLSQSCERNR